jgi:uncharacterized membrane protein
MRKAHLPNAVFGLLVLAAAIQSWIYYPRLADPVASHFGGRGIPNGWQSKPVFFAFYFGAFLLAAGIGFGVPKLIAAVPVSLLNLQNKEYWMAPERRAETLAYFENAFAWFACATAFLEFTAFELALRANLEPAHKFASGLFIVVLVSFLFFVAAWIARLILHFSRIPQK